MMKLILAAAVAASIGLPSVAIAETSGGSSVCRVPKPGEATNGTVQNAQLVCKPINIARVRTSMMAVMNDKLTSDQKAKLQDAMSVWEDELMLDATYPGFNGNPNN